MLLANANLISCNFSTFPSSLPPKTSLQTQNLKPRIPHSKTASKVSTFSKPNGKASIFTFHKGHLQICHSTLNSQKPEDPVLNEGEPLKVENGGDEKNWTTSILLFLLWGALMFYVFTLSPNQTPVNVESRFLNIVVQVLLLNMMRYNLIYVLLN